MLKKIEVKTQGDSSLLPGEIIDRIRFENMNEQLIKDGKNPAVGERVLMGITKASLQTESFISAASFQETTRVLTDAAIKGKVDKLSGYLWQRLVHKSLHSNQKHAQNTIEIPFVKSKDTEK